VFGAIEVYRSGIPKAEGVAVGLLVAGAEFSVSSESAAHREARPESLAGGSMRMISTVADPDTLFA
jgi:PhnB protein